VSADPSPDRDPIAARALVLCAAHQDRSPTRQPCAACTQQASTESDRLTDAERALILEAVVKHNAARAVLVRPGEVGWSCTGCGQPLENNNDPARAFGGLTVHQADEYGVVVEGILAARALRPDPTGVDSGPSASPPVP